MSKCKSCEAPVSERTVKDCWSDVLIPDHNGVCCDCFDAVVMGTTKEEIQRMDALLKEPKDPK